MKNLAIILAAGSGERFGDILPKQFQKIAGRTLLQICLEKFAQHLGIDAIYVVGEPPHLILIEKIVLAAGLEKVKKILAGGKTRQESSFNGVHAVPEAVKNVLIHDAARAFVNPDIITRVLDALENELAVLAAIPSADTIVTVNHKQQLTAIPDRSEMWQAQTPQGFRLQIIKQAHTLARADGFSNASDDCSLVLRYKLAPVVTVLGDPANIKITYPQDLAIAEAILKNTVSRGGACPRPANSYK